MTFGFVSTSALVCSLRRFWFCPDKIESIELPNLVPRQRIDDCFEIPFLIEDFVISCYQSHQNFSARGTAAPLRLLQGALVILDAGCCPVPCYRTPFCFCCFCPDIIHPSFAYSVECHHQRFVVCVCRHAF